MRLGGLSGQALAPACDSVFTGKGPMKLCLFDEFEPGAPCDENRSAGRLTRRPLRVYRDHCRDTFGQVRRLHRRTMRDAAICESGEGVVDQW
jgi:hypothetical protein